MKSIRKLLTIVLCVAMVMMLAIPALAAEGDTTGSITIGNATKGQTYEIYKIFDATASGSAISYTIPANSGIASAEGFGDIFTTSTTGGATYVTTKAGVTGSQVAAWLGDYVKSQTPIAKQEEVTSDTVKFENVDYGYYYVTSTLGTSVTVDSVNKDVTLYDKNVTDDPVSGGSKVILKATGDGTTEEEVHDANNYDVGDELRFKITFTAQNYVKDKDNDGTYDLVKEYKVVDTPTGLMVDTNEILVTVNGNTVTLPAGAVSVVNGVVTVTIPWASGNDDDGYTSLYSAPATVVVNYLATLDASGVATNSAAISATSVDDDEYEHNPDPEEDLEDEIVTYTIAVNKVDGTDNTKKLAGAEFVLMDESGAYYVISGGNVDWVSTDEDTTLSDLLENGEITVAVTNDQGAASFTGLAAGTYKLVETKAPAGYNLLSTETPVTVGEGEQYDDDTVTTVIKTIENNTGSELPSTGGMGTTILYTLGLILVLGAGILLVVRRRMSAEG